MDWNMVIEGNRDALKRIVAMLVAMAGLAVRRDPCDWRLLSPGQGERWIGPQGRDGEGVLIAGDSPLHKGVFTLPRHLHRAILRLLRPAESAVRRLIIVAARGLVVALLPTRPRKARPTSLAPVLRSLGIAVVTSGVCAFPSPLRGGARGGGPAARPPSLPLLDPLKSFRPRRRYVPAHAAPRILGLEIDAPYRPLPAPPAPDDQLDATRITQRLQALGAALDDLPGQARRFARWKARKEARRTSRNWPLRPGRAPGQLKAKSRRQEVHDVLSDLHWFAFEAMEKPDTS